MVRPAPTLAVPTLAVPTLAVPTLTLSIMAASILAAMVLAFAVPIAHAQTLDWSRAGGGLFPGEVHTVDAQGAVADSPASRTSTQPFDEAVSSAAARHGLDAKLLHALVAVESAYRQDACSPAGACGLTQLMPGTARDLGVYDRFEPSQNLDGGADYLARQLRRFGDVRLALAAYNSGPERVARLGRIPEIAETQAYVVRVVDCYLALTAGRAIRGARDCEARGGRP